MKKRLNLQRFLVLVVILFATVAQADDLIPKAAWRRPLGLALENPGTSRVHGDIDDGYWQGAPVGGFGSGTFSRSYRGDFARWHMLVCTSMRRSTQSVTRAYSPQVTPHVFVFDSTRHLRYEGRFDNSYRIEQVKTQDARNAIDALLARSDPSVTHTGTFGCSTKWAEKSTDRIAAIRKLDAQPVERTLADKTICQLFASFPGEQSRGTAPPVCQLHRQRGRQGSG